MAKIVIQSSTQVDQGPRLTSRLASHIRSTTSTKEDFFSCINSTSRRSRSRCGNILSYEACLNCNSGTGNSFTYDPILESFDEVQIIPDPPSQFHFNIYLSQVPSFQTLPSFPQQYPCCEDCGVLPEADHCQPPQYTINHLIFNAHNDLLNANNDLLNSQNKINIAQNKLMEQLTSMCTMVGQIIQKKQEEKQIEEEQAANARYWKILACCDDDDDYNSAITPNEPIDSLSMGDEHLNTISGMESDEFIKSSVENLVPNPSESEGENGCDVPACFTTFLNVLFDAEYEFNSSDDQSLSDEDVPEKIFSNPLFEEEIVSKKIDSHHFDVESDLIESLLNHDSSIIPSSSKVDSLLDEFADELTLLKSIPPGVNETDCYPEKDIRLTKRLLYDNSSPRPPEEFVSENSNADIESFSPSPIHIEDKLLDIHSLSLLEIESYYFDIPLFFRPPAKPPEGNTGILNIKMMGDIFEQKVPIPRLMITLVSNQEKSPNLLSHRSLKIFQLSAKCPMMIHGKNIPILDVPLFYFYPLDQLKYGGIRLLPKDFILQVFIFSASIGNHQYELYSSGISFLQQAELSLLAVGTSSGSGKSSLAVGMPCTVYSQQFSPKLDAASAIKFLELNAP
nr:hypothetical protein [Tanacetum cinerariifolium]